MPAEHPNLLRVIPCTARTVSAMKAGLLAAALGLCSCAAPPEVRVPAVAAPLEARFAALQVEKRGRLYRGDAAASTVRIYVFRAGRAARLGHNHVLAAPRFEAWLLRPEVIADARFELRLRLDELQLDDPALRAAIGGGFASPLSPEAVAATRANMLSAGGLDAAQHPELGLRLLALAGEPPKLAARIEVALAGRRHALSLPLTLHERADGGLRIDGAFVLRHSDVGLQPFSVAGGLLAVQDELVIEFSLSALPV
jgi:hypothetical protein